MYADGIGVAQDAKEAVRWYRQAAAQGNAEAQLSLGLAYGLGEGVAQDEREAVGWWQKAAAQGNADAQFDLGMSYEFGSGVLKDPVHAHMWYNIAAANGSEEARKFRNMITKTMTPSQIEDAQARARTCVKQHYKGC